MTAKIIDGLALAKPMRTGFADRVAALARHGVPSPGLAVLPVGEDPASTVYVGRKVKACSAVGIHAFSEHRREQYRRQADGADLYGARRDGADLPAPGPATWPNIRSSPTYWWSPSASTGWPTAALPATSILRAFAARRRHHPDTGRRRTDDRGHAARKHDRVRRTPPSARRLGQGS